MGTKFTIILYAPDEQAANRSFKAAFRRIEALDLCLSDYQSDSEINRLSRTAPTPRPGSVSDDLLAVLLASQRMSQRSGGAFDITVGPLTKLWRRARRQRSLPSEARLDEARAGVGYQLVKLDASAHTAELLGENMRLDVGAIAKGYAVDQALIELGREGIEHALVNASGDMAASGPPPGKPGWHVGIAPLDTKSPPSIFGRLAHQAVATSGDTFQFVEINGTRYSHIVDPRTGIGLTQRSNVTVLARTCIEADALASAASVLGPVAGLRLIERTPDAEALIVLQDGDRVVTKETNGFAKWISTRKVER
jgi:thiamine biosynthesis lipoprotein